MQSEASSWCASATVFSHWRKLTMTTDRVGSGARAARSGGRGTVRTAGAARGAVRWNVVTAAAAMRGPSLVINVASVAAPWRAVGAGLPRPYPGGRDSIDRPRRTTQSRLGGGNVL